MPSGMAHTRIIYLVRCCHENSIVHYNANALRELQSDDLEH